MGRHLYLQPASWRLRTALVVPIVLLVPLFLAVTGVLWEGEARREAETLVARRQETALSGLSAQLQQRREANKTIVYLLSKRDGLASAIESGNTLRMIQTLVLMQASLNLDYINVYASNGQRLLHVGGTGTEGIDGGLVASAILGHDASAVGASESVLVIAAAASVSGTTGTAGVLVVGTTLPATSLRDLPSAEEVAVYRAGKLVDTSIENPDVRRVLEQPVGSADEVSRLNVSLAPLHVRAAGLTLSPGNFVLAMVPIDDLDRSSQQRTSVVIGGTLALVIVLMLIALLQARAVARPLEKLVAVAGALVRGEYRRVEPSGNFEVHALGQAVNHLADQLERKLAELTHQATHDPLSGLPNRKLFRHGLEEALAQGDGASVAVLFLDLDSFKIVNDSLGHASGDLLIVAVTERLQGFLSLVPEQGATLARIGGDEFTILLPHAADDLTARRVAERVAETLSEPFQIGRHELVVSASIGVARSGAGLTAAEDLLRAADVAMYRAKAAGRGNYVMYESAMGRRAAERLEQETELRQAIEGGALRVFYQPIVDLATGRIREVEALARWQHPQRGLVSPAEFIPLAEETGLIVPLGRWVLDEAFRQLRAWHNDYPSSPPLIVNVNLSARQLQQPDLAEYVARLLTTYALSPGCVTLEITESCLMQDSDAGPLHALAELGVNLAIDDFGTGYSSLAYLSRLPINTLKIDRSFVAGLGLEPESDALVQTIIALAHALRLGVTAEGIEQPDQADQLQALGCTRGQGFLYARPVPAAELDFTVSNALPRAA
jgi:diguanylate cyclase (GGDEF)-like protein